LNCPHCAEAVSDTDNYCESCGRPLDESAQGLAPAVEPGASRGAAVRADLFSRADATGQVAAASHRGLHHAENQDAVGFDVAPGCVIMAVADGVSSSVHERAAADAAVVAAVQSLRDAAQAPQASVAERMKLAVHHAHAAVLRLPDDAPPKSPLAEPQATLVLALIDADRLWYAWVGDSRIYLITDSQVRQLSTDDSFLGELLASGVELDAAMKSPDAHCITQCLGMRDASPDIHVASEEIPAGARILLCSDGFWNYAPYPQLVQALVDHPPMSADASLESRCIGLIDFANARGGSDNITVALYRHGVADRLRPEPGLQAASGSDRMVR